MATVPLSLEQKFLLVSLFIYLTSNFFFFLTKFLYVALTILELTCNLSCLRLTEIHLCLPPKCSIKDVYHVQFVIS